MFCGGVFGQEILQDRGLWFDGTDYSKKVSNTDEVPMVHRL